MAAEKPLQMAEVRRRFVADRDGERLGLKYGHEECPAHPAMREN